MKSKETYYNLFNKSSILKDLDESFIKKLFDQCVIESYSDQQTIIDEGSSENFMYFILQGLCSVKKDNEEGQKVYIMHIDEGEQFGEAGIFSDTPRTANVEANESVIVAKISKDNLLKILFENNKQSISFLLKIISTIFIRLKNTTNELKHERRESLSQDDVESLLSNL